MSLLPYLSSDNRQKDALRRLQTVEKTAVFSFPLFCRPPKASPAAALPENGTERRGSSVTRSPPDGQCLQNLLRRQLLSALQSSSRQNLAAVFRAHSLTKAVLFCAVSLFGLVCSQHCYPSLPIIIHRILYGRSRGYFLHYRKICIILSRKAQNVKPLLRKIHFLDKNTKFLSPKCARRQKTAGRINGMRFSLLKKFFYQKNHTSCI